MMNGTQNGAAHGRQVDAKDESDREMLWDSLPPPVTEALSQPLPEELVSRRSGRGSRSYAYIEGHAAIEQANSIFGYGGWGYEAGEVALREIETVDRKTGEVRVHRAYTAPVRVDVPGAPPRTDVGFHAVADESAEGHETAFKGAVTDGLKRALRSFGDQFGNALYGETTAPGTVGAAAPRPRGKTAERNGGRAVQSAAGNGDQVAKLREELIELGAIQGFDEQSVRDAVTARTGKQLVELSKTELAPLVESASRKAEAAGDRAAA